MVQWNMYIDQGKTISTMGMIDFWPEKKFGRFSSIKGSRHFPRIRFLSEQSYIIPVTRVPRPGFFLIFFHTPQRESPNSIQQNRIRRPQLRISSGERNQRDCEYIPHWILLRLSADTLFAATRRA
jgi:hypothetical protein